VQTSLLETSDFIFNPYPANVEKMASS